ncbi:MAG: DUF547 domain-containing protein [Alphaproteobacteria bacterium]|nr:DUF547 domain-containing protein [Alphaproteobacteria bacterium]
MSATDQPNGAAIPPSRRALLGAAIGLGLAGIAPRPAAAAPRAELWPRWQRHDAASTRRVDHTPWDAILAAHHRRGADGIARFAYAEAKEAGALAALRRYLDAVQATDVDALARPEQMAYWINLYNALTVATVLDRYPVESIRDIRTSPGLFAIGPWGAKVARVGGEVLSLDDIEHRILRPIWRDARIQYAVNCAALGCPDLQPRAFRAASLEATLDTRRGPSSTIRARRASMAAGGWWCPQSITGSPPISAMAASARSWRISRASPSRRWPRGLPAGRAMTATPMTGA